MARVAALALVAVVACDKQRAAQQVVDAVASSTRPPRTAPKSNDLVGGMLVAGDPSPVPAASELLAKAKLVGIGGGADAWLFDDAMPDDNPGWIGPRIDRAGGSKAGRDQLALRRAAFASHVPAIGARGDLDDRELAERGVKAGADLVALVGPERSCIAGRGTPFVQSVDLGGHVLDVRWRLDGCGEGPWAPVGFVTDRMPAALRWVPYACEPDDATARWQDPAVGAGVIRLGAIWQLEAPIALIGVDDDGGVVWIVGDDGLQPARRFATGDTVPRRIDCGDAPATAPADIDDAAADDDPPADPQ